MIRVLGDRIKASRERLGWSQTDLAEKVGQSDKMAVSKWERGIVLPSAANLDALADALGVSVDYLLGRTADPRGVVNESDLSAAELNVLALIRQRDVPALLRVVTNIAEDTTQQRPPRGEQGVGDESGGVGGQ